MKRLYISAEEFDRLLSALRTMGDDGFETAFDRAVLTDPNHPGFIYAGRTVMRRTNSWCDSDETTHRLIWSCPQDSQPLNLFGWEMTETRSGRVLSLGGLIVHDTLPDCVAIMNLHSLETKGA